MTDSSYKHDSDEIEGAVEIDGTSNSHPNLSYDCLRCEDKGSILDADGDELRCPSCNRTEEFVSVNTRNVPRSLRNRFKAWCSQQGLTMQDCLVNVMQKLVDSGRLAIFLLLLLNSTHAGEVEEAAGVARLYGLRCEAVLKDKTRVDLLSSEYAIEVDWTSKWAEAIGQALYYSIATEKKPGILLLQKKDVSNILHQSYLGRCKMVCERHGIELWTAVEGSPLVYKVYPADPFFRAHPMQQGPQ